MWTADYIQNVLADVKDMKPTERQEMVSNYRCLVKRSSSRISTQLIDPATRGAYHWGIMSDRMELAFMVGEED